MDLCDFEFAFMVPPPLLCSCQIANLVAAHLSFKRIDVHRQKKWFDNENGLCGLFLNGAEANLNLSQNEK